MGRDQGDSNGMDRFVSAPGPQKIDLNYGEPEWPLLGWKWECLQRDHWGRIRDS